HRYKLQVLVAKPLHFFRLAIFRALDLHVRRRTVRPPFPRRVRVRSTQRFALYLALVAQVLLPACSRDTTYHGAAQEGGLFGAFASSFDLGEKMFTVVRSQLSASTTRAAEKVAALDARHDDFVNAVNAVITADAIALLGPTIKAFFGL